MPRMLLKGAEIDVLELLKPQNFLSHNHSEGKPKGFNKPFLNAFFSLHWPFFFESWFNGSKNSY